MLGDEKKFLAKLKAGDAVALAHWRYSKTEYSIHIISKVTKTTISLVGVKDIYNREFGRPKGKTERWTPRAHIVELTPEVETEILYQDNLRTVLAMDWNKAPVTLIIQVADLIKRNK